ncbi:MAG TPA: dihydroneopterin aldolase [Acidimicrobiales bacterium]|nr:dihydroneopterin aldolase [Acidimicrobiales bacterium]
MTGTSGPPPPGVPGEVGGDRIQLRSIRVVGTHGVLPEERERAQPFEVDLELWVDLAAAAGTDRLSDTVDYARVAEAAAGTVSGPPSYQLLEALAGAVARVTLEADPRITAVTVGLRKLQPPLAMDIATVGVRITRRR